MGPRRTVCSALVAARDRRDVRLRTLAAEATAAAAWEVSAVVLAQEKLAMPPTNGLRRAAETDWRALYRIGGIAAVLAAAVTPIVTTAK